MQKLTLCMYRLITWALVPLVRARLKRRAAKEPLYGQWMDERFGRYTQPAASGWVWVHAVSLGETRAAAILLHELRAQIPGMKLLLTHGTATGRAEGEKLLQAGDVQVWQPWDHASSTRAFFRHFKPRMGIVMETEVWPQLCQAAQEAGVPLVLANARLNDVSAAKAQRLAWLSRPAFASFAQVLAQTQDDAARLQAVGAQRVQVMGNLKFDVSLEASALAQGQALKAASGSMPVILLASSREGEEAQFLEQIRQYAGIKSTQNATDLIATSKPRQIQWMIVPRHPQRFDEVQRLCEQAGFSVSRRSSWLGDPMAADVWLGDSMGEMPMYFALADLALLGGSFAPLGGQNLIEAIAAGCPVVMGPHTFNFAEACETAQQMGAALRCANMASAVQTVLHTAQSESVMLSLKQQGQQWLAQSRGAAARMARAIAQMP
ncbi:MAG: 3-deoxy-D-manno-octulosonic acid transferase [Brachymonas sp.]